MRRMPTEKDFEELEKLIEALPHKYIVENITNIGNDVCGALKCGDIVVKEDESGQHAYVCSFQKNEIGLCITYTDATVVETVSYNYVTGNWVYNSTDVTHLVE